MVELALVFPLFATLLFSVGDLAQFLFLQQALVERARYAARWGAINDPTNTAAITNMVLHLQPTAPSPPQPPNFGLEPSMVQVSREDDGTENYRLVVRISGFRFRLFTPGLSGNYLGRPIEISVPLGIYN